VAKQRVLIVDDDDAIRTSTAESLVRHDREIRTAESATVALAGLDRWRPDVVLSDVRMPGIDGLELLQLLTERVPDADVIMMTAFDDMPTIVSAMRAGAVEFLVKPLDLSELRQTIDRLFADRAERKNGDELPPPPSLDVLVTGDARARGLDLGRTMARQLFWQNLGMMSGSLFAGALFDEALRRAMPSLAWSVPALASLAMLVAWTMGLRRARA